MSTIALCGIPSKLQSPVHITTPISLSSEGAVQRLTHITHGMKFARLPLTNSCYTAARGMHVDCPPPAPPPLPHKIHEHALALNPDANVDMQVYSEQIFAGDKPLGMVDIPLVSLSVDGEEWEQNYSLEPFGKLRAGGRLGSIHLRLKMGPVVDKRFNNSSKIFEDLSKALEDRGDEDVEHLESPPNFLRVTLHQVTGIYVVFR